MAIWNTNGSFADVYSKYTGAARGDTVILPDGDLNWDDNSLGLTKGIYLKSANGRGATTVTGSGGSGLNGIIAIVPDATVKKVDIPQVNFK